MSSVTSSSISATRAWFEFYQGEQQRVAEPVARGMCYLRRPDTGEVWALNKKKPTMVGSHPECDLVINDPWIRAWHAAIRFVPVAISVVDLKSSAGSFTERRQFSRTILSKDCRIDLGDPRRKRTCSLDLTIDPTQEPRLKVWVNRESISEMPIRQDVLIVGRSSSCDLSLPVSHVSRRHVRLSRVLGTFVIEDLHSDSRTTLRGRRVQSDWLIPGDSFEIGGVKLSFAGDMIPAMPPEPVWRLMTRDGIVELDKPILNIGRDADCDIRLDGVAGASRHHARLIWRSDGTLALADLNSIAGTMVNGHPVSFGTVLPDSLIQIGDWRAYLIGPR